MTATMRVRDLRVAYGGVVVSHVDELDLDPGCIVGVAGESGSGKSQAALAMIGLAAHAGATVTGSLTLDGAQLTTASERRWREVRGRRVAMIMQSPRSSLNPTLRVGTLFARTLRLHGLSRAEARNRTVQALSEVLLEPDILRRYPHEVSGGQAQRVAIALVTALRADVVLADEPTSALDVTVQAEVVQTLAGLRDRHGTAILFISHDLAVISQLADSILVMREGRVVESGPAARVLISPAEPYTAELLAAVPVLEGGPR